MAESTVCVNARASLEEIRALKRDFETAYETAVVSGKEDTIEKTQELKRTLETKIRNLRETVAIAEAERLFELKNQYKRQTGLLKKTGLVETRMETTASGAEREVLLMTGIDGEVYPIPSYETVASRLFERRELLETKADQGFKKLVLVPFGMSLDAMIAKFKAYLLGYKKTYDEAHKNDMPPRTFALDVSKPVWVWDKYAGADENGAFVYDPVLFDKDSHGGSTKAEILANQRSGDDDAAGWRVLLLQGGHEGKGIRGIPRNGAGMSEGTKVPRKDIEAGKSLNDYLANLLAGSSDEGSSYRGESGMTSEEWIVLFMAHLEETGEPLDDWQNRVDSIAYLTGAYFTASDNVPSAYWNRADRLAYLDWSDPGDVNKGVGVRSAVRA